MTKVLNAFESCRPRGPDAPTYAPPIRKLGQKGNVGKPRRLLNSAGKLQAALAPAGRGSAAYALRVDPVARNIEV